MCGTHDLLEGETPSAILDSLGSLITDLKQVNEGMNISVCQLGPTLRSMEYEESLNYLNDQLESWCTDNGVNLIKSELSFKLGTGETDDVCYNIGGEDSGIFLNRLRAGRLLTAISKQCEKFSLCENWEEAKRSHEGNSSKQKPRKFQQNSNLDRINEYTNPDMGREDNYYHRTPIERRERPRVTCEH